MASSERGAPAGARARLRVATPRWWRIGTGGVLPAAMVLAGAAALIVFVPPFRVFALVALLGWVFLIIGLAWVGFARVQALRYRWDRRVLIAPVIAVVIAALLLLGVPLRLGWAGVEGTMTARAQECVHATDHQWVGVYPDERVFSADAAAISSSPADCSRRSASATCPRAHHTSATPTPKASTSTGPWTATGTATGCAAGRPPAVAVLP